jgi:hypothetical protein
VHFASDALKPGFCHACNPVPRLKVEEGLWAEAAAAVQPTRTARASVDFIVIPRFGRRIIAFACAICSKFIER